MKAVLDGLKGGGHNVFNAAQTAIKLAKKIPKSVTVTNFPLSSLKYLMYLAEMCCDSKTCFWSMNIPGQDPLVLLWVWWVSLALSCSLNLCHSLCRFLHNHLYCLPTTPLQVCVLRWLVAEVTNTAQSPSTTSRCRFPSASPANLLSFRCCACYLQF